MRIILIIGIVLMVLGGLFIGFRMYTKSFSPQEKVVLEEGDFSAVIKYSRPYKKDRNIFGALVPYDTVWRTGANEATTLKVTQPINIQGNTLAAGKYSLFTIPGEDEWTVIFNEDPSQWGAFFYKPEKDVLRVTARPEPIPGVTEQFTIRLSGSGGEGLLEMEWDQTRVPLLFTY